MAILQRNTGTIEGDSLPCNCEPDDAFATDEGQKMTGKTEIEV